MKKGFTLIELLVVIILLGIIITLASISVTEFRKNSQNSLKEQKIKYIESGALKWGEEHLNLLSSSCYVDSSTGKRLSIQTLINGNYITGDDDSKEHLLIPGTSENFNSKCVCVKYENVFAGKNLSGEKDNNGSSYKGNTNYQVTVSYGEGACN